MARFVFELEAVLEQRAEAERRAKLELGRRQRELAAIRERAEELQRALESERRGLRQALDAGPGARVSLEDVRLAAGSSLGGAVRLQRLALEAAGAQSRLEAARSGLVRAAVARKAIEVLKQRRYARWRQEQDRREVAALDDLMVMRHGQGADELDATVTAEDA